MKRITAAEAESILGKKLDRRRAYFFNSSKEMRQYLQWGPVFTFDHWTTSCSGCRETEDGYNVGRCPWDPKAKCYVGSGCHECGYTGKRRDSFPAPVK